MKKYTKIRLVRNATLILNYAGKKILVDPMLGGKGTFESFAGIAKNPTVNLPFDVEKILDRVDLTIISHKHIDHIDPTAIELLDKNGKVIIQPEDEAYFKEKGFRDLVAVQEKYKLDELLVHRTIGQHGRGQVLDMMGPTSGFILEHVGLPKIFIIGDSILTDTVVNDIAKYSPDIIVCNTGGAIMPGYEDNPILMDENEAIKLIEVSGAAKIIAVHMDALDHCRTSRKILQEKLVANNIPATKLFIPNDGDELSFF